MHSFDKSFNTTHLTIYTHVLDSYAFCFTKNIHMYSMELSCSLMWYFKKNGSLFLFGYISAV